jgi:predicted DsbA family dithiol-disulfide isomerase
VPADGVDLREYLEGRYGPGALDGMSERLGEAAAAEGLPLQDLRQLQRRPNTFAAHRLLTEALVGGEEAQQALADELLAAYWARGADVGAREVLEELAAAAGMPAVRVAAALDDEPVAAAVRDEERRAAELGIRAVPTFVFDGRFAVSGAQPARVLAGAARRALTGA